MNTRQVTFPNELPVDPDQGSRAVFVHVDQGLFAPHSMRESFQRVEETYTQNREARFQRMAEGVLTLEDIGLDIDFVHDHRDANSKDLLVVMSPLNDGRPESDVSTITNFVERGTKKDVGEAKPNSHRPAAKLNIDYEFGHAEGMGMPRLQLFAREAPAMTSEQRRRVAKGDMTPYGELAARAIQDASRIMHETYGTGDFDRVHFFAAGMGAKALGATAYLLEHPQSYQVGGVTLMNFALGEESIVKRGRDYSGRRTVGEASKLILPTDYVRVPELSLLTELDKHGPEFAMRMRQVKAMSNLLMTRAIMNASKGVGYIEKLLDNGSTVTVANGVNEAMVTQTEHYLPVGDGLLRRTDIVGVEGKKVGMAANEHGAALAVISNLGLYNHLGRNVV